MFVAGIGFGGVAPVAGSMVGEFAPREIRGALMGWTQISGSRLDRRGAWWCGRARGGLAPGVCVRCTAARAGSDRSMARARVSAIPARPRPAGGAEALARQLWERFGARIELPAQEYASRVSLAAHLRELWGPRFRRETLLLWTVWCVMIGAYNGPVLFLPAILAAQGFAHTDQVSLVISCVMIVPTLVATMLVDRAGRKPVFVGALALAAVGSAVLAVARSEFGLSLGGSPSPAACSAHGRSSWSMRPRYTPPAFERRPPAGRPPRVGRGGSCRPRFSGC